MDEDDHGEKKVSRDEDDAGHAAPESGPVPPLVEGAPESGPVPSSPASGLRISYMAVHPIAVRIVEGLLTKYGVSASDREDARQEALAEVARVLPSYDALRPIEPWIYTIVRRKIRDHQGRAHKRREVTTEDLDDERRAPSPEHRARIAQARAIAQTIFEGMPEELVDVYVFCELNGFTDTEVACVLGISENTVRSRLATARRRVEEACKRRGLRSVPLVAPFDRDGAKALGARLLAALRLAPWALGAIGALLFGAGVLAGMMWMRRWAEPGVMASPRAEPGIRDAALPSASVDLKVVVPAPPLLEPSARSAATVEPTATIGARRTPIVAVAPSSVSVAPAPPPTETAIASAAPPPTVAPAPTVAPTAPPPDGELAAEESQREAQLIRGARQALLRRDPARALELLNQHQQQFPRGAFVSEREKLRRQAAEMKE